MTDIAITKFPAIDIRTISTGGGRFDVHVSIATITGQKVFLVNDGTAQQLYLALQELFGAEERAKMADLFTLAYQYADDLKHPVSEDSKKRRLDRIKEVVGKV